MSSSAGFELVLAATAVAAIVLVVGLGVYSSRRRTELATSLRAWAAGRGWQYIPVRDELAGHLPGEVFDRGDLRRCRNLVRGALGGLPLTAFDYSYAVPAGAAADGSGGDPATEGLTTYRLKVLLIELPTSWPRISASPQDLISKLAVTLEGPRVAIGHPVLDQRLRVTADDEQAATRLIAPLADALLARPDQALEVQQNALLLYRPGLHEPADLESWLGELGASVAAVFGTTPQRHIQDGSDG